MISKEGMKGLLKFTSAGKVSNLGFGAIFTSFEFLINHGSVQYRYRTPQLFPKQQDLSKPRGPTPRPWVYPAPEQALDSQWRAAF